MLSLLAEIHFYNPVVGWHKALCHTLPEACPSCEAPRSTFKLQTNGAVHCDNCLQFIVDTGIQSKWWQCKCGQYHILSKEDLEELVDWKVIRRPCKCGHETIVAQLY